MWLINRELKDSHSFHEKTCIILFRIKEIELLLKNFKQTANNFYFEPQHLSWNVIFSWMASNFLTKNWYSIKINPTHSTRLEYKCWVKIMFKNKPERLYGSKSQKSSKVHAKLHLNLRIERPPDLCNNFYSSEPYDFILSRHSPKRRIPLTTSNKLTSEAKTLFSISFKCDFWIMMTHSIEWCYAYACPVLFQVSFIFISIAKSQNDFQCWWFSPPRTKTTLSLKIL